MSERPAPFDTTGTLRDVIQATLSRPVAYHSIFARIAESTTAGLMLSQAWYWTKHSEHRDGWFWKTQQEWRTEVYLTRYEQETARRTLRQLGLLDEERRGSPAKLWFRVNLDKLYARIVQIAGEQHAENRDASVREASKLVCGKAASSKGTKTPPQTTLKETPCEPCGSPESARRKSGKLTDTRHQTVVQFYVTEFEKRHVGLKAPLDGSDGKALQRLLRQQHDASSEELCRWLSHAFQSDDVPPLGSGWRLRQFCAHFARFVCGPVRRNRGANVQAGAIEKLDYRAGFADVPDPDWIPKKGD